ncbi:hypothetical protein V7038_28620 [Bacillus sp. JJ783]
MALLCVIMIFVIFMSVKVMGYVRSVSNSHKEQVSSLTKNIKEERGIHYKLLVEERKRSDRRERELFINLEKNTEQLEGIATTLKKVQFSYASLENKVMQNFEYLESEIENVKMQVTKKATNNSWPFWFLNLKISLSL